MESRAEEELRKICRTLTPQQLRFVAERPHCNSDREAAKACGIPITTVAGWPNKVHKAVKLMASDGVIVSREILRKSLPLAATVKAAGLRTADDKIRQAAATEILDRFLGKASQSIDLSGDVGVTVAVLNDDERAARIAALLDKARARRDGPAPDDGSEGEAMAGDSEAEPTGAAG